MSPSTRKNSADTFYTDTVAKINTITQQLEATYDLTLKNSNSSVMTKCRRVQEILNTVTKKPSAGTTDLRSEVEELLSDIDLELGMMESSLRDFKVQEANIFAKSDIYPLAYYRLVENLNSPIQQAIALFKNYRPLPSYMLHPKRRFGAEADKIVARLEFFLKQDWTDEQKQAAAREYIEKVKNGLIATMKITIGIDTIKLSSFLKRANFTLQKLFVIIPAPAKTATFAKC